MLPHNSDRPNLSFPLSRVRAIRMRTQPFLSRFSGQCRMRKVDNVTSDFQALGVPLPLVWVVVNDNIIPPHAVPFTEQPGGPQFIARALLEGHYHLGKAGHGLPGGALITYGSRHLTVKRYEVLAFATQMRWSIMESGQDVVQQGAVMISDTKTSSQLHSCCGVQTPVLRENDIYRVIPDDSSLLTVEHKHTMERHFLSDPSKDVIDESNEACARRTQESREAVATAAMEAEMTRDHAVTSSVFDFRVTPAIDDEVEDDGALPTSPYVKLTSRSFSERSDVQVDEDENIGAVCINERAAVPLLQHPSLARLKASYYKGTAAGRRDYEYNNDAYGCETVEHTLPVHEPRSPVQYDSSLRRLVSTSIADEPRECPDEHVLDHHKMCSHLREPLMGPPSPETDSPSPIGQTFPFPSRSSNHLTKHTRSDLDDAHLSDDTGSVLVSASSGNRKHRIEHVDQNERWKVRMDLQASSPTWTRLPRVPKSPLARQLYAVDYSTTSRRHRLSRYDVGRHDNVQAVVIQSDRTNSAESSSPAGGELGMKIVVTTDDANVESQSHVQREEHSGLQSSSSSKIGQDVAGFARGQRIYRVDGTDASDLSVESNVKAANVVDIVNTDAGRSPSLVVQQATISSCGLDQNNEDSPEDQGICAHAETSEYVVEGPANTSHLEANQNIILPAYRNSGSSLPRIVIGTSELPSRVRFQDFTSTEATGTIDLYAMEGTANETSTSQGLREGLPDQASRAEVRLVDTKYNTRYEMLPSRGTPSMSISEAGSRRTMSSSMVVSTQMNPPFTLLTSRLPPTTQTTTLMKAANEDAEGQRESRQENVSTVQKSSHNSSPLSLPRDSNKAQTSQSDVVNITSSTSTSVFSALHPGTVHARGTGNDRNSRTSMIQEAYERDVLSVNKGLESRGEVASSTHTALCPPTQKEITNTKDWSQGDIESHRSVSAVGATPVLDNCPHTVQGLPTEVISADSTRPKTTDNVPENKQQLFQVGVRPSQDVLDVHDVASQSSTATRASPSLKEVSVMERNGMVSQSRSDSTVALGIQEIPSVSSVEVEVFNTSIVQGHANPKHAGDDSHVPPSADCSSPKSGSSGHEVGFTAHGASISRTTIESEDEYLRGTSPGESVESSCAEPTTEIPTCQSPTVTDLSTRATNNARDLPPSVIPRTTMSSLQRTFVRTPDSALYAESADNERENEIRTVGPSTDISLSDERHTSSTIHSSSVGLSASYRSEATSTSTESIVVSGYGTTGDKEERVATAGLGFYREPRPSRGQDDASTTIQEPRKQQPPLDYSQNLAATAVVAGSSSTDSGRVLDVSTNANMEQETTEILPEKSKAPSSASPEPLTVRFFVGRDESLQAGQGRGSVALATLPKQLKKTLTVPSTDSLESQCEGSDIQSGIILSSSQVAQPIESTSTSMCTPREGAGLQTSGNADIAVNVLVDEDHTTNSPTLNSCVMPVKNGIVQGKDELEENAKEPLSAGFTDVQRSDASRVVGVGAVTSSTDMSVCPTPFTNTSSVSGVSDAASKIQEGLAPSRHPQQYDTHSLTWDIRSSSANPERSDWPKYQVPVSGFLLPEPYQDANQTTMGNHKHECGQVVSKSTSEETQGSERPEIQSTQRPPSSKVSITLATLQPPSNDSISGIRGQEHDAIQTGHVKEQCHSQDPPGFQLLHNDGNHREKAAEEVSPAPNTANAVLHLISLKEDSGKHYQEEDVSRKEHSEVSPDDLRQFPGAFPRSLAVQAGVSNENIPSVCESQDGADMTNEGLKASADTLGDSSVDLSVGSVSLGSCSAGEPPDIDKPTHAQQTQCDHSIEDDDSEVVEHPDDTIWQRISSEKRVSEAISGGSRLGSSTASGAGQGDSSEGPLPVENFGQHISAVVSHQRTEEGSKVSLNDHYNVTTTLVVGSVMSRGSEQVCTNTNSRRTEELEYETCTQGPTQYESTTEFRKPSSGVALTPEHGGVAFAASEDKLHDELENTPQSYQVMSRQSSACRTPDRRDHISRVCVDQCTAERAAVKEESTISGPVLKAGTQKPTIDNTQEIPLVSPPVQLACDNGEEPTLGHVLGPNASDGTWSRKENLDDHPRGTSTLDSGHREYAFERQHTNGAQLDAENCKTKLDRAPLHVGSNVSPRDSDCHEIEGRLDVNHFVTSPVSMTPEDIGGIPYELPGRTNQQVTVASRAEVSSTVCSKNVSQHVQNGRSTQASELTTSRSQLSKSMVVDHKISQSHQTTQVSSSSTPAVGNSFTTQETVEEYSDHASSRFAANKFDLLARSSNSTVFRTSVADTTFYSTPTVAQCEPLKIAFSKQSRSKQMHDGGLKTGHEASRSLDQSCVIDRNTQNPIRSCTDAWEQTYLEDAEAQISPQPSMQHTEPHHSSASVRLLSGTDQDHVSPISSERTSFSWNSSSSTSAVRGRRPGNYVGRNTASSFVRSVTGATLQEDQATTKSSRYSTIANEAHSLIQESRTSCDQFLSEASGSCKISRQGSKSQSLPDAEVFSAVTTLLNSGDDGVPDHPVPHHSDTSSAKIISTESYVEFTERNADTAGRMNVPTSLCGERPTNSLKGSVHSGEPPIDSRSYLALADERSPDSVHSEVTVSLTTDFIANDEPNGISGSITTSKETVDKTSTTTFSGRFVNLDHISMAQHQNWNVGSQEWSTEADQLKTHDGSNLSAVQNGAASNILPLVGQQVGIVRGSACVSEFATTTQGGEGDVSTSLTSADVVDTLHPDATVSLQDRRGPTGDQATQLQSKKSARTGQITTVSSEEHFNVVQMTESAASSVPSAGLTLGQPCYPTPGRRLSHLSSTPASATEPFQETKEKSCDGIKSAQQLTVEVEFEQDTYGSCRIEQSNGDDAGYELPASTSIALVGTRAKVLGQPPSVANDGASPFHRPLIRPLSVPNKDAQNHCNERLHLDDDSVATCGVDNSTTHCSLHVGTGDEVEAHQQLGDFVEYMGSTTGDHSLENVPSRITAEKLRNISLQSTLTDVYDSAERGEMADSNQICFQPESHSVTVSSPFRSQQIIYDQHGGLTQWVEMRRVVATQQRSLMTRYEISAFEAGKTFISSESTGNCLVEQELSRNLRYSAGAFLVATWLDGMIVLSICVEIVPCWLRQRRLLIKILPAFLTQLGRNSIVRSTQFFGFPLEWVVRLPYGGSSRVDITDQNVIYPGYRSPSSLTKRDRSTWMDFEIFLSSLLARITKLSVSASHSSPRLVEVRNASTASPSAENNDLRSAFL